MRTARRERFEQPLTDPAQPSLFPELPSPKRIQPAVRLTEGNVARTVPPACSGVFFVKTPEERAKEPTESGSYTFSYAKAKDVLVAHREHLEVIAKALLEYETLDGLQIKEIIKHGRLLNPPPGPPPSSAKMPPEKPPKQVVQAPDVAPPLPGALGGAPA